MKVRIGVGATPAAHAQTLTALAGDLEELGFDSLWVPEVLTQPGLDPMLALTWVAATTTRLKLGTTMLLPGRHPLRLAKQAAQLDRLSGGRLLLTLVPGLARGAERAAVGVPPAERGRAMEELLPVLKALWAGEPATFRPEAGGFSDLRVDPTPAQDPFDVWLGGLARASLERCGRLADGWLPAMCTPAQARDGRAVVEEAAAAAGRAISPEHFGVSVGYATAPLEGPLAAALAARAPGVPLEEVVPVGLPALRALLEAYLDQGFSKFVVRPLAPPASWRAELESLADAVGDLQT